MNRRIVLVEGDPDQAILVESVFRRTGREAELAAVLRDGPAAEAWILGEASEGRPPTLVLLDLDLPDDAGFALLRRIRRSARLRALPVVAFSSVADDDLLRRAYEQGANSCVAKPDGPADAVEAYAKLLEYWTRSNVGPELGIQAAPPSVRGGRVLVVDDDPAMLEALTTAIAERGHAVVRARDGREALARLRADAGIRLIVLDAVLPGMDGWALREAMKSDPRLAAIPAVVISAYGERLRERPIDSAAFFAKPFPVEAFLASLERLGA